jgi:hypothetical protein
MFFIWFLFQFKGDEPYYTTQDIMIEGRINHCKKFQAGLVWNFDLIQKLVVN